MTLNQQSISLGELIEPFAQKAQQAFGRWLVEPACPAELAEAIRYSVLGGGKRLRPALVLMVAQAYGGALDDELTLRTALAVEMVHCYSLVHDDLPAMDDDVLRRGLPTVHVKFGQAMAILTGDALLTRAFAVLAEACPGAQAGLAVRLIAELSAGCGQAGMIAGQVADMELCSIPAGIEGLRYIHRCKTGALIVACGRMGAICAGLDDSKLSAVTRYCQLLGLAFQVADDILDVTGKAENIGKTPGKDAASGKKTYVSILGLEQAKALSAELANQACAAAGTIGQGADNLALLARLLAQRTH
jgi:geranylgeranyl pyrophosphate synthase